MKFLKFSFSTKSLYDRHKKNLNNLIIRLLRFCVVRAERLELSHREALDPKSSVSTNSTTPAF